MRTIPETSNRQDWPRLVAKGINEIQRAITPTYAPVTANYTVQAGDYLIGVDATAGNVTVTLPLPSEPRVIYIKKLDASANTVTASPVSGTIDGAASLAWGTQWQSYTLVSTGTDWLIA